MQRKKPIIVTVATEHHISRYDLEGTRDAIIKNINTVFDAAAQDFAGVEGVELYSDWSPRMWDEGEDLYIYVRRPESDEEKRARKDAETSLKADTTARELKLLEQLQAKYAGKV
jgi:hypothetical protein